MVLTFVCCTFDSGIMRIGTVYIPVDAHLSNKACKKVCELSISLPQIMKVIELPMSKVWPKGGEASVPTAESIGLFFFSHNTWFVDPMHI